MLLPLHMNTIERRDRNWSYLTTERYRIDEHTLDVITAQSCTDESGPLDTLLPRVRAWIGDVLCNRRSDAPLRITKHLLERAQQYENARSRCGRYVELLPEEHAIIERLTDALTSSSDYKIVEIGLNGRGNICKIALLLPFDQWLQNGTQRKLFLLIGCDGGLKTFYAVPDFKYRRQYQMDEGIKALSLEQLVDSIGVVDEDGWTTVRRRS